jgi:hypothetical protein
MIVRFIIMHKTNAHWESGAIPSKALIGRVGTLLGRLAREGVLVAGEGLRASSEGVRLRFAAGTRTLVNGPFQGDNELAAGFSVVRTRSLEDAIEWATRQREVIFDGPFVETKELLAGYIVVSGASLEEAERWALQYIEAVEADEVDLRELE